MWLYQVRLNKNECEAIEDKMFHIYLFSSPSLKCRVGLLRLKTNSFLYALLHHSVQWTIGLKSFVCFLSLDILGTKTKTPVTYFFLWKTKQDWKIPAYSFLSPELILCKRMYFGTTVYIGEPAQQKIGPSGNLSTNNTKALHYRCLLYESTFVL